MVSVSGSISRGLAGLAQIGLFSLTADSVSSLKALNDRPFLSSASAAMTPAPPEREMALAPSPGGRGR
jgi:hypothetical protein